MLLPTYQVKRETVFIGQVVKVPSIKNKLVLENGKLAIYNFTPYRSILFTLNDQNLASDLLYASPEYPALNFSSEQTCFDSEILIRDGYNLEQFLTFFEFPDSLGLTDMLSFRKRFFTPTWVEENSRLFYTGNPLLSPSIIPILTQHKDYSYLDILRGNASQTNSFYPHEEEGKIYHLTL